jgi:[protein-PII] uridylyltransferase
MSSMKTTTRTELKSFVDDLKTRFFADPGLRVETIISNKIDEVIRDLWGDRDCGDSFALMAIGGYGRATIHPQSDIDLLFFFKDTIDEEAIKAILHPLWDLQFKVGHQIRHADDLREFDESQMESYTAFLDARMLLGDPATGLEFERDVMPRLIQKNRNRFLKLLADMKSTRYKQFGDTIYQLEPDIKEAPGGLRDVHWSGWVRKALEASNRHPIPQDALQFLHCLRNFLHFYAERNVNLLAFDYQEQIASQLGYRDSERGEATENLMRDYFLKAGDIARPASFWEDAIVGTPNSISFTSEFSDPFEMIEAFAEAHQKKARLDSATLSAIKRQLASSNGALSNNPRAGRLVLDMMKDRKGIYDTLLAMHEVGLLGRIFPDFEEIRCRVIRDFFHKYTVDEHSLIAIRNIEELPSTHRFSLLLNELENPELLLLSLLFHDIGKSHRHDEGNHVHPSTEGVKVVLDKLELPLDQADKVVAVVKNHLEMSKIILRRDFSDQEVVRQFADVVGNIENLRMLCLMTYADMKAVNNEVVTPWKEDLLWQLYVETYNLLTLGLADDQYTQQPSLESDIAEIAKLLPRSTSLQNLRDFLDGFPRQYLKNTPKKQIADHFLLSRKLADQPMAMHLVRNGSVYDLLVMTADRPGLFSKVTGVLSYFGMNIVRAQAFSNRHGTIFDLISFEDASHYFEKNPTEIDHFSKLLNEVIDGKVQLSTLLERKFKSVMFRQKRGASVPTTIHFDRGFSARCTIMELVAQDGFGLLYRIASVISARECNIEVALITTEGHRAIDVFYITRQGTKLSPELEGQVERDLIAALSPQETQGAVN